MLKIEKDKPAIFFGDYINDQVIPKDHFPVKLSQVVDFSFVNGLVKDLYCENNGRLAKEQYIVTNKKNTLSVITALSIDTFLCNFSPENPDI